MNYFNHRYASNSDIKKIVSRHEGRTEIEGLQAIFDFGSEFDVAIFEPHKRGTFSDLSPEKNELIKTMAASFWKDEMLRQIMMGPDFRRQHEFYRVNRFGLEGIRCKCDGDSRKLGLILELKGLAVSTEKAFKESILHLDYDQGAAWYLEGASGYVRYERVLIAGVSKTDPERPPFKMLIDRNHDYYLSGMGKIEYGTKIWKMFGLN